MIDFSKGGVFDLRKVQDGNLIGAVNKLFINGEILIGVYQSVRDQVVFTNKRIITIDVQGVTGKKKEFFTIPYARIQYFCIQTPGLMELISDSELVLYFADGAETRIEFKGTSDILEIGRAISCFAL